MESSILLKIPNQEFTIINYPLIVNDEEKALKTLGGIKSITEFLKNNSYEINKKRIRLYFRPDMIYAKPIIGEFSETKALLLKMKFLKNKKTNETKVVPEVLGKIKSMYDFNWICDYQYNPHQSIDASNSIETANVFYDHLSPPNSFMELSEFNDYINSTQKTFLPPIIFTKLERPSEIRFFKVSQETIPAQTKNIECNMRSDISNKELKIMGNLFKIQKMWLSNSLNYSLKTKGVTNHTRIARLRREIAHNITTGPWGRSWAKKDYEYMNDPESRMFQVIEFRSSPVHINFLKKYLRQPENTNKGDLMIEDCTWRIDVTHLPTTTNCFYQLHDIGIPEVIVFVQNEALPAECHETYGWFLHDVQTKIRNLIQNFLSDQVDFLSKNNLPASL